MKKTFACIITALAFVAAPAFAQGQAAADPAAKAAVQDLLAAMHVRETLVAAMKQATQGMTQNVAAVIAAGRSNTAPKTEKQKAELDALDKMLAAMTTAIEALVSDPVLIDELVAEMGPLYTRNFTLSEIRELTAFYRTPLGQKTLTSIPAIMRDSTEISNRLLVPRMRKLLGPMTEANK